MTGKLRLAALPRLYIGQQEIARLRAPADTDLIRRAGRWVARHAAQYVKSPAFEWQTNTHNAHLVRARRMQNRVVTLLAEWLRTGKEAFRRAAVEHVIEMGNWEYWSWITWRQGNPDPNAIFDLSYGENSATLAVAYDLLYHTLSSGERARFIRIARKRSLGPCLLRNSGKNHEWWWSAFDCNWLTVCAGGAGMLALSMYEDLPEARKLLPMLDRQIMGFMKCLDSFGGGWCEGPAYWNYAFRYAFMYYLSHERATGNAHQALRLKGTRETLSFPINFSPHNLGASFGDGSIWKWTPLPFHYAAARRLGRRDLLALLDRHLALDAFAPGECWPDAAEYLMLRGPGAARRQIPSGRKPVAKLYPKMDWGFVADRMPEPNLYMSVRGGSTRDPHGHMDLLSFHCVVGDENLIPSLSPVNYLDTTFSDRRYDMFDVGPLGKNTIVIGGVGITHPSAVRTRKIAAGGALGFHLDASQAAQINLFAAPTVRGVYRAALMLDGAAFLIVDRVELRQANLIESRFCTPANVRLGEAVAHLRGRRRQLAAAFAASEPCVLVRARGIPTWPQTRAANMVRWCSRNLVCSLTSAMLLTPGSAPGKVALSLIGRQILVDASGRGFRQRLRLSPRLLPIST